MIPLVVVILHRHFTSLVYPGPPDGWTTLFSWRMEGDWWTYFFWSYLVQPILLFAVFPFVLAHLAILYFSMSYVHPPFRRDVRFGWSQPIPVCLGRLRPPNIPFARGQPCGSRRSRYWPSGQRPYFLLPSHASDDSDVESSSSKHLSVQERKRRLTLFRDLMHKFEQSQVTKGITPAVLVSYVHTIRHLQSLGLPTPDIEKANITSAHLANTEGLNVPIVIDTGCSFSVTPFIDDFIERPQPTEHKEMGGMADHCVSIEGMGWVEWQVKDVFGKVGVIRTQAYFIPDAKIRLLSSQTYFQEIRKRGTGPEGYLHQTYEKIDLGLEDGTELIFPFHPNSNLPLMYVDFLSAHTAVGLNNTLKDEIQTTTKAEEALHLLNDNNYNLTNVQKELSLWHYRLGHMGFGWLQSLFHHRKGNVGDTAEPPVIRPKFATMCKCDVPKCAACQLAKQHRRKPGTETIVRKPEREMAIRRNKLTPGQQVSIDQYISRTPGRLPHTFGKERPTSQYNGGTLIVDHATGFIFSKNQVSLGAGETLQTKHAFERFAEQFNIKIRGYRADNHPFDAAEFKEDIDIQNQRLDFSGVGAHFQNGVAERALQTVTSWALAMMMHQMLHWPDEFDAALWPYALDTAVVLWNHIPREDSRLSPLELFCGIKSPSHEVLLNARVWGSVCFTLDPKLQDGHRLPKWTKKSRQGMYLGPSQDHSSTVGRILNLNTGHISPQYHVVYDELFSTVHGHLDDDVFDETMWNELIRLHGVERLTELDEAGQIPAPFDDNYRHFLEDNSDYPDSSSESSDSEGDDEDDDVSSSSSDSDSATPSLDGTSVESSASEGDDPLSPENLTPYRTRSGREVKANRKYPDQSHTAFPSHKRYQYLAHGNQHQKVLARHLNRAFLASLIWKPDTDDLDSFDAKRGLYNLNKHYNPNSGLLEDWDPFALATKANSADTPTYEEAMNGPDAEGFLEACRKELTTLINMKVWDVVKRQKWMNVLPSSWAFKVKRFPDGTIRKLKKQICGGRSQADPRY